MAIEQYTMFTYGGFTPGISLGLAGANYSDVKMGIWKTKYPNIIGEYRVIGSGVGLGAAKLALVVGATSNSEFESTVPSVDQFFGQADSTEASAAAIFGMNYQTITWQSGPAAGTVCTGSGLVSLLGASIGVTQTKLEFKFLGLASPQKLSSDPNFKGLQLNNGSSVGFSIGGIKPSPLR